MADEKPTLLDWLGLKREPDYSKARWLGVVVSGLALALIVSVFGFTLYQFIEAIAGLDTFQTPESQSAAIRNTGLVLAAIIGIPFVVWRSVVAQKQVDVAEQGQITDRINKAVEGLGAEKTVSRVWRNVAYERDGMSHSAIEERGEEDYLPEDATDIIHGKWEVAQKTAPNLEVRVGAIYALERIAQDSDRDHVQIMEILCTYIRENAPKTNADLKLEHFCIRAESSNSSISFASSRQIKQWAEVLEPPRIDVQTALTILGRRSKRQIALEGKVVDGEWEGFRLDLRQTCLQKADVSSCNLNFANLSGSHLEGADLKDVQLMGANLGGTKLQGAGLENANLQDTDLVEASLQSTFAKGAQLQKANLATAKLQNSYLGWAKMEGAHLASACLQGAGLGHANLRETNLKSAQMQGVEMNHANLSGANLFLTKFDGVYFDCVVFDEATDLSEALILCSAFRGCDLTEVDLTDTQLTESFGDSTNIMPEHNEVPFWFSKNHETSHAFLDAWYSWATGLGFDLDDPSTWDD